MGAFISFCGNGPRVVGRVLLESDWPNFPGNSSPMPRRIGALLGVFFWFGKGHPLRGRPRKEEDSPPNLLRVEQVEKV